jgi:hypothetical protein
LSFLLERSTVLTDAALLLIGIAAVLIVPIWALVSLSQRRTWRCSECGFETYDEAESMGHKKYHEVKHVMVQD